VELGLVGELAFGGEVTRYDGRPDLHLNMICLQCRRITDLPVAELEVAARVAEDEGGFQVLRERHEVYGICPSCRRVAKDGVPAAGRTSSEPVPEGHQGEHHPREVG